MRCRGPNAPPRSHREGGRHERRQRDNRRAGPLPRRHAPRPGVPSMVEPMAGDSRHRERPPISRGCARDESERAATTAQLAMEFHFPETVGRGSHESPNSVAVIGSVVRRDSRNPSSRLLRFNEKLRVSQVEDRPVRDRSLIREIHSTSSPRLSVVDRGRETLRPRRSNCEMSRCQQNNAALGACDSLRPELRRERAWSATDDLCPAQQPLRNVRARITRRVHHEYFRTPAVQSRGYRVDTTADRSRGFNRRDDHRYVSYIGVCNLDGLGFHDEELLLNPCEPCRSL